MTASSPIEVTTGWNFVQIPADLLKDSSLSIGARFLFSLLACFANSDKKAWPSEETLAEHVGVTTRTVRNYLNELKEHGWIHQKRRRQTSAVYLLPSLPDRKQASHQDEEDRKPPSYINKDRKQASDIENQDRKSVTNKTGKELPPNDNNITIARSDQNDKDSAACAAGIEPFDAPGNFSVKHIKALKLTRAQWTALLHNERQGKARKSLITFVENKLNQPAWAALVPAMLDAIEKATVQSISDPGMGGQFRKVAVSLLAGDRPYSAEDVLKYATQEGPIENVHWLAGALSKWRNGGSDGSGKTLHNRPGRGRAGARPGGNGAAWHQQVTESLAKHSLRIDPDDGDGGADLPDLRGSGDARESGAVHGRTG